jgi:hypothetical protein
MWSVMVTVVQLNLASPREVLSDRHYVSLQTKLLLAKGGLLHSVPLCSHLVTIPPRSQAGPHIPVPYTRHNTTNLVVKVCGLSFLLKNEVVMEAEPIPV